mgnify:CR=1 FL=1
MCSEFTDKSVKYQLKISGPSVLLEVSLTKIIPLLPKKNLEVTIDPVYEGDALKNLLSGQSHIAIVTDEVLINVEDGRLSLIPLGGTSSKIIASHQHAIFDVFPQGKLTMNELLNYDFICPKTSPFCGIERGIGSDGWPDYMYPRMISFRSDDINSQLSLVSQSAGLAYVADVIIDKDKVRVVEVIDFDDENVENYSLVYRASTADGWLNQLISAMS